MYLLKLATPAVAHGARESALRGGRRFRAARTNRISLLAARRPAPRD